MLLCSLGLGGEELANHLIELLLSLPQLVVVVLIFAQLVHALYDALGHHQVLVFAEEAELYCLEGA